MIYLRFIINKLSKKLNSNVIIMQDNNFCRNYCYKNSIDMLNNLVSNASYIRDAVSDNAKINNKLDVTRNYLIRSGLNLEQLDELSIIHVAGTKGKGSTCAYVERILREHGYKTGLYTSPHLVSVRERIRINGEAISECDFSRYFLLIYKKLINQRTNENDMPSFFQFLTLMMFHIFHEMSIDVAIIEVGIGGELDCTNIIRNPVCVGISKLDLDHVMLLGDNLKAIAYQKSGIFKNNSLAFTVPQSVEAMSVLYDRAIEKNSCLNIVPPISSYLFNNNPPKLGMPAKIQYYNASLAIQLSNAWLSAKLNNNNFNNKEILLNMNKIEVALGNCQWAGRTQFLRGKFINFYLDGAHTVESMFGCIEWFKNSTINTKRKRILMFNVMGNRDTKIFLNMLKPLNFSSAFFVPNTAGIENTFDQYNKTYPITSHINGCEINCNYWGVNGICAESVNQAINIIKEKYQLNNCVNDDDRVDLLITGSLHLVGAALSILDPNLSMTTNF